LFCPGGLVGGRSAGGPGGTWGLARVSCSVPIEEARKSSIRVTWGAGRARGASLRTVAVRGSDGASAAAAASDGRAIANRAAQTREVFMVGIRYGDVPLLGRATFSWHVSQKVQATYPRRRRCSTSPPKISQFLVVFGGDADSAPDQPGVADLEALVPQRQDARGDRRGQGAEAQVAAGGIQRETGSGAAHRGASNREQARMKRRVRMATPSRGGIRVAQL
jgi:hypothetical protein